MQDIFTEERRAWLAGNRRSAPNDKARMQAKFDAARVAMGDKYCCHPSRRVQRLDATYPAWIDRAWQPPYPPYDGLLLREKLREARVFRRAVVEES